MNLRIPSLFCFYFHSFPIVNQLAIDGLTDVKNTKRPCARVYMKANICVDEALFKRYKEALGQLNIGCYLKHVCYPFNWWSHQN